jgi:hypothetical protein
MKIPMKCSLYQHAKYVPVVLVLNDCVNCAIMAYRLCMVPLSLCIEEILNEVNVLSTVI